MKKDMEWKGVKTLLKDISSIMETDPYPVIVASVLYNKVKELTNNPDPWKDIKAMSNLITMNIEYAVRDYIFAIEDPKVRLKTAIIFSALANTLDFGTAMHNPNIKFTFPYLMEQLEIFENAGFGIDDFDLLYDRLILMTNKLEADDLSSSDELDLDVESVENSDDVPTSTEEDIIEDEIQESDLNDNEDDTEDENYDIHEETSNEISDETESDSDSKKEFVVMLLDNAGEIVLDKIMIEVLQSMGIEVIAVVKGAPVSNDATMDDAEEVDLTSVCKVVTTGSSDLGFNPRNASKEFLELLMTAPLVIAKGQANFESINTFREAILHPEIFLFAKFKCPVNSGLANVNVGDYVLWKMQ